MKVKLFLASLVFATAGSSAFAQNAKLAVGPDVMQGYSCPDGRQIFVTRCRDESPDASCQYTEMSRPKNNGFQWEGARTRSDLLASLTGCSLKPAIFTNDGQIALNLSAPSPKPVQAAAPAPATTPPATNMTSTRQPVAASAPKQQSKEIWLLDSGPIVVENGCINGLPIVEKAIAQNPRDAGAFHHRGTCHYLARAYDKALADYTKGESLRTPPYWADPYSRGIALKELGRIEEAEAAFRRAIALDNKQASPFERLGTIFLDRKLYADALGAYDTALAIKPTNELANEGAAIARFHLGRYADAQPFFDEALRTRPDDRRARLYRAQNLDRLDRLDEALADINHVLAKNPDDSGGYMLRWQIYNRRERFAEAQAALEAALRIEPNNDGFKRNLEITRRNAQVQAARGGR